MSGTVFWPMSGVKKLMKVHAVSDYHTLACHPSFPHSLGADRGGGEYPWGGRRPEDTRGVAPASGLRGQGATPLRPVFGAQPPSQCVWRNDRWTLHAPSSGTMMINIDKAINNKTQFILFCGAIFFTARSRFSSCNRTKWPLSCDIKFHTKLPIRR